MRFSETETWCILSVSFYLLNKSLNKPVFLLHGGLSLFYSLFINNAVQDGHTKLQ